MIFYLYNIYRYLVFSILRMKTKRSTPHGSTRKNKRMMSGGGKTKMSKITRRFKDHFKRFIGIDDNKKIKKCESWGSLNGIFKFLKADKETYKVVERDEDGATVARQVSGIEKMKKNIKAAPDTSSNKDRYIKAIECFENGGDTILSGIVCVPYADFVNSGGAPAPATSVEEAGKAGDTPAAAPLDEEGKVGEAGKVVEGEGEKVEGESDDDDDNNTAAALNTAARARRGARTFE